VSVNEYLFAGVGIGFWFFAKALIFLFSIIKRHKKRNRRKLGKIIERDGETEVS